MSRLDPSSASASHSQKPPFGRGLPLPPPPRAPKFHLGPPRNFREQYAWPSGAFWERVCGPWGALMTKSDAARDPKATQKWPYGGMCDPTKHLVFIVQNLHLAPPGTPLEQLWVRSPVGCCLSQAFLGLWSMRARKVLPKGLHTGGVYLHLFSLFRTWRSMRLLQGAQGSKKCTKRNKISAQWPQTRVSGGGTMTWARVLKQH